MKDDQGRPSPEIRSSADLNAEQGDWVWQGVPNPKTASPAGENK